METDFREIPAMKRLLVQAPGPVTRLCGPWLFVARLPDHCRRLFSFSKKRPGKPPLLRRALSRQRGALYHLWCTFRQYQNFTTIHLDRFLARPDGQPSFTSQGWQKLESVIGSQGGVLLMSHLGNWEMAARLLQTTGEPTCKLLLYMGVKEKEGRGADAERGSAPVPGSRSSALNRRAARPLTRSRASVFCRTGDLSP